MPDIISPSGRVYGFPTALSPNEPSVPDEAAIQGAQKEMDEKLDKLSIYIRGLFNAFDSSTTRKRILKFVAESRKCYYQEAEETDFPWPRASNMISPLTTMGVDEVEPRLVSAVIGREPYIKVKPLIGTSTRQEAMQITKFDNHVLEHLVGVKELVPQMVHEQLIDGTIYPLLSWEVDTKRVKRFAQDPTAPNGISRQITEVTTSKPGVELIPIEFVWHADNINDEDWENADVIRYVGNITVGEIKERSQSEEGWMLPKDWTSYAASSMTYKTTQQETEKVADYIYAYEDNQKPIEFYEAYVKYPLFDDKNENLIVLVELNSFKIFRVREQLDVIDENIKPLRRIRFLKRRGISWGYPLYTLIAGIQLGVDAMWNRCVNSADITMTPWGFIKRGLAGLRKNKVQIFPGAMIEVDNPEAVNFPNITMFQPQQFVPLILQYISFFERTLNVSDFMQGRESQVTGKKGSTATGTLAILQEGKVKFEYRGGLTHNEYLSFFKNIHDLCVSNMTIEDHIRVVGTPMLHYSSTDEYLFTLDGSDLVSNRFVDRQETESFAMTMQPYMAMLNPMTLLEDILDSYQKEARDYINPELAAIVQQYMIQKANEEAMKQMGLPEDMAKMAASQGYTAENVQTFIEQMGKQAAQADSGEESGESGGRKGAV